MFVFAHGGIQDAEVLFSQWLGVQRVKWIHPQFSTRLSVLNVFFLSKNVLRDALHLIIIREPRSFIITSFFVISEEGGAGIVDHVLSGRGRCIVHVLEVHAHKFGGQDFAVRQKE